MALTEVAYLGPVGTYSHLVAEKRYGRKCKLVPFPSILQVCAFVSKKPARRGIIPIENSSGGTIYETVDILMANEPRIYIVEELSLEVKLALLGRKNEKIEILYSHFAPLEHCVAWLNKYLPHVQKRVVSSTAIAARHASDETGSAALGNRRLASLNGLNVIKYPIATEIPNITTFLSIAGQKLILPGKKKITIMVKLPNTPGSLCTFLEKFRNEAINLSRILSRPIRGCPREYAFMVDLQGNLGEPQVDRALKAARKVCVQLRIVGCYPSRRPYMS
ncbi:MAG: prephenate dehydratase domain-containing protein [Kiritimatiellae bacterium]|nr:prephenate dehydratase domain-containing protein [Kiritimatiellia bacterium]MDD5521550.1 prephenate dehydratase domain-containing protein [Kiritimatiellia bacterium]